MSFEQKFKNIDEINIGKVADYELIFKKELLKFSV
jgi:hypothetical protein